MSDPISSTLSIICSLTSLALSAITLVMVIKMYNNIMQTQRELRLQMMKDYNRRQREYIKAVCAGELGKPQDN